MTRRKTDGERLTQRIAEVLAIDNWPDAIWIAARIDRLIRQRMAEAWEDGWLDQYNDRRRLNENPYRGRSRKK